MRNSQKRDDQCQLARTKEGSLRVFAFNLRARKKGPDNNNLSMSRASHSHSALF